MQMLNSQSEWEDNCSDLHYIQDFERHCGSCIQQMYKGNWPLFSIHSFAKARRRPPQGQLYLAIF